MTDAERLAAWNVLVLNADPNAFSKGDERRAAALACRYMGEALNGGINAFLTGSWDLDGQAVLAALEDLDADIAAQELRRVLDLLGAPLPVMSQDERWELLDRLWPAEADSFDFVSADAYKNLERALEAHVQRYLDYYLSKATVAPAVGPEGGFSLLAWFRRLWAKFSGKKPKT